MANYDSYSYGAAPSSRGPGKLTIILVLVLIGFIYFNYFGTPSTLSGREGQAEPSTIELDQQTFSRQAEPEETEDINTMVDQEEEAEFSALKQQMDWGFYATYGYYGEYGYPDKNACGYFDYGYPTYIGTNKEGQTCADALPDLQDLECLLNAPAKYEGTINILEKTSSPILTCCVADGTCHWRP